MRTGGLAKPAVTASKRGHETAAVHEGLYTKEGIRPYCSNRVRTQPRSGWLIGGRLKDPSAQNAVGRLRPTHQIRVL